MLRLSQLSLDVDTHGRGLVDVTAPLVAALAPTGIATGLATIFIHHTSASLLIGENADPAVLHDLETFFAGLCPDGDPRFTHTAEGPDDMPAHVRAVLTATSLTVPVTGGRLALGTWQGIFVWEHRQVPHRRRLSLTVVGA